eukprot:TRINITY_DN19782_c0_g1_i2.p1 TRINITY_DN19782_c0_g1~~TRINITY_DN19782_c0_g1_i2.p1  ORF type:complete len:417 (+),score=64.93 TRINITY_DN19782_c0_g1_i2:147-1397(+)
MDPSPVKLMTHDQKREFFRKVRELHRAAFSVDRQLQRTSTSVDRPISPQPSKPPKRAPKRKGSPKDAKDANPACPKVARLLTFPCLRVCLHHKLLICGQKSTRLQVLRRQLLEAGAHVQDSVVGATHVFVDRNVTESTFQSLTGGLCARTRVLTTDWLEQSLAAGKCQPETSRFDWTPRVFEPAPGEESDAMPPKPAVFELLPLSRESRSFSQDADTDFARDHATMAAQAIKQDTWIDKKKEFLACQMEPTEMMNKNAHITKVLEEMQLQAELDLGQNATHNQWRAYSYKKVIQFLKRQPKPLTSMEDIEASGLKNVRGFGAKMLAKIEEIICTGTHQRMEKVKHDPESIAMKRFTNVWGAGQATARKWVSMGLCTLEDVLREGSPTANQLVGIARYDDLLLRMPRSEVQTLILLC